MKTKNTKTMSLADIQKREGLAIEKHRKEIDNAEANVRALSSELARLDSLMSQAVDTGDGDGYVVLEADRKKTAVKLEAAKKHLEVLRTKNVYTDEEFEALQEALSCVIEAKGEAALVELVRLADEARKVTAQLVRDRDAARGVVREVKDTLCVNRHEIAPDLNREPDQVIDFGKVMFTHETYNRYLNEHDRSDEVLHPHDFFFFENLANS